MSALNACEACAAAKRKCGKQKPHCFRCKRRGTQCTYPPPKPSCFVLCEGEDILSIPQIIVRDAEAQSIRYPVDAYLIESEVGCYNPSDGLDRAPFTPGLAKYQLASSWFASSDTWEIRHVPQAEQNYYTTQELDHHTARLLGWLAQWAEHGSNPFIHPRLYRTRFPQPAQDAYTVMTCYINKTAENEFTVFQIIEDKAKKLVADTNMDSNSLDPLEHLARVQALLVYQMIGLYDGNIRLRHLAESHIPVLNTWVHQMVERARQETYLGLSMVSSSRDQASIGFTISEVIHLENQLWYGWILAESIRRTWVVVSGAQGSYIGMQKGRAGSACLGGMMFTTRQGIWEAKSAPAWEKLCSEVNTGLLQLADTERLFTETDPANVNDFTIALLQCIFGLERMQRWGVPIQE